MPNNTNSISVRIKNRIDTEANYILNNPILLDGEIAYTSDVGKRGLYKLGDGVSHWSELTYQNEGNYPIGHITNEQIDSIFDGTYVSGNGS